MTHLKRLVNEIRSHLFSVILLSNIILLLGVHFGQTTYHLEEPQLMVGLLLLASFMGVVISSFSANFISQPIKSLWQAILHVGPHDSHVQAPNLERIKIGKKLVTNLVMQVYQLASQQNPHNQEKSATQNAEQILLSNSPLPILACDAKQRVIYANSAAERYFGNGKDSLVGRDIYSVVDMYFTQPETFGDWLQAVRTSEVAADHAWEYVKSNHPSGKVQLFDMAAHFTKDHPSAVETVLFFFDRTEQYSADQQSVSFIALAAHELRSPLTLLRGYIDVFDEELEGKLDPELAGYMQKMQVSAQQFTSFITNILNVSKVEDGQLSMTLGQQAWVPLVQQAITDMSKVAGIRGKSIEYQGPTELEPVAADHTAAYEVLTNLLDNAIKYSGDGPKKVTVSVTQRKDGLIETTVHDDGIGIAAAVVPHLFEKFYRSHRTQLQVGGTGLGLYLCRAIVDAHGGSIWIDSKEGKGTTVGFTLQPFSAVAAQAKPGEAAGTDGIVRVAHGWIKNHSRYQR